MQKTITKIMQRELTNTFLSRNHILRKSEFHEFTMFNILESVENGWKPYLIIEIYESRSNRL